MDPAPWFGVYAQVHDAAARTQELWENFSWLLYLAHFTVEIPR